MDERGDEWSLAPAEDPVLGRSVAEGAEAVLAADRADDREAVEATLRTVADDDDTVIESSLRTAVEECGDRIAWLESRVDQAAAAVADAAEEAAVVDDLAPVAARLQEHESRLDALMDDLAALQERYTALRDRSFSDAYAIASELRSIDEDTDRFQRRIDVLIVDLRTFTSWLDDHEQRVADLSADLDVIDDSVSGLERTVASIVQATDVEPDEAPAPATSPPPASEPAAAWRNALLHEWVYELSLEDLRTELEALDDWPRRSGEGTDADLDAIEDRLDDLQTRLSNLGAALDEVAPPAWREAHGHDLERAQRELAGLDRPVDWERVQTLLSEYEREIGSTGTGSER